MSEKDIDVLLEAAAEEPEKTEVRSDGPNEVHLDSIQEKLRRFGVAISEDLNETMAEGLEEVRRDGHMQSINLPDDLHR